MKKKDKCRNCEAIAPVYSYVFEIYPVCSEKCQKEFEEKIADFYLKTKRMLEQWDEERPQECPDAE